MSEQIALDRRYVISIFVPTENDSTLTFTYAAKGLQEVRSGGVPMRAEKFIVAARQAPPGLIFDWSRTQDDPGGDREEIEAEIAVRMKDRRLWIDRVTDLVSQVEHWATELGWATRRLRKRVDDSWIGKHDVPALLMQEDICKVMLEPVARSIAGTEGVVDLYLMPAYDDIASLYYHGDRWYLQHVSSGDRAAVRESEAVPLSKMTLEQVLAELTKHAA
jgi:hypothetical protein